ncbi:MAG: HEAT repeat domain-containing protein [Planctomycetota bacterium]
MRRLTGGVLPPLTVLLLPLLLLSQGGASGDTIYLRNGSSIDGVVLGTHEGYMILQIGNLGRMEIPQKEILTVEKNARTGYVDPERGTRSGANPLDRKKEGKDKGKGDSSGVRRPGRDEGDGEAQPLIRLDAELEKKIKAWIYDLTRQRSRDRVRAERRLTEIGSPVIPMLLPIAMHPSDSTRLAVFRIFKKKGDMQVVPACLDALQDQSRFVRKLAWETLRRLSGRRYPFPWDDSSTERQREDAGKRWHAWWEKAKKRIEKQKEAEAAAMEGKRGAGD